jgi:hypothetical protein
MEKKEQVNLGATGELPDGKIAPDDEGELRFAMGVTEGGEVFMDFGKPVKWVAFPPEQAMELGRMLTLNANRASGMLKLQQSRKIVLPGEKSGAQGA